MVYENKGTWLSRLTGNFNDLMHRLDMPDDLQNEIRPFIMQVARDQYKAGNSSGIRWARMNPATGGQPM